MACIVKNKEFRALQDKFDIHEDALEQIIKEWQGDIPAREGVIPSAAYIREQISGKDNFVDAKYLDKATKIWERKFSEPKIFDSLAEANVYKDEANKFFVEEATYVKKTKDGKWSVTTQRPEESTKFSIEEMRNLEPSGLYNLLDFMSRQKEYGDSRRGQLLSKLHDRYYLPKTTSQDALERFRVMYLLPEGIFNLTKVGDATEVTINEDVLKDAIERNNRNIGFDNLFDSAEEAEETKKVLDFLSSKTGLKYETISEERAKELLGKDEITNINAFVKGDTAYFIEGRRLNTDIAAEEMLHPFVASIKAMNVEAFNSLVVDARKAFPKLRLEINKSYTKDVIGEELVTQALSRAFREDIKENPHGNNVKTLLKNFLNYIVSIFKSTFGDNNIITKVVTRIDEILEKKSFNASDLVQNIKIADLAKLINSELNISGADFIKSERLNEEEKTKDPYYEDGVESINIFVPTGENDELSNFAYRPFDDGSGIIFNTVEGAFQAAKLTYSKESVARKEELIDELSKVTGVEAAKIGRKIEVLTEARGAWDIQSPSIMKNLIKASFQQNPDALQKLLATGNATLTYIQYNRSKWGTEFPRILMEVRSELRDGSKESFVENKSEAAKQNVPQAIRKTNEGYVRQAVKFNREIDNLLNGTVVAPIEARETAVQIAYFMHDTITALLEDPKIIFNESLFGKQDVKDVDKETEKVKKMSRRQLVQYIGVRNLINYVKSQVFDNVQEFWTGEMLSQAQLFKDNFDALVKLGTTTFLQIEDFGITSNTTTEEAVNTTGVEDFNVIDNPGIDADDFMSSIDYESVLDEIGNLQEHWQIESRSLDVLQNATALVKEALGSCYITKRIETKNEDGTTSYTYEPTVSKWGIKTRMNPKDATSSILLWTRGSLKLSDMITRLEKASQSNPWVQQIIDRLKDTSGKESEFQSQFYKVFEKHFQLYGVVSRDAETGKLKAMPVNQRPALREAMRTIRNAYEAGTSPLFADRRLNQSTLSEMTKMWQDALAIKDQKFEDADLAKASRIISLFMNDMGYNANEEMVLSALSQQNLNNMVTAMGYIVARLKNAIGNIEYKPFEYNGENSISGNIRELVKPIADLLEDVAITSINQSGKTYQSNVTPSYLSKMMIKLQGDNDEFSRFIQSEYFGDAWYRDQSKEEGGWKNKWLYELSRMDEETRKKVLAHKVQLNFNGQSYMRGMTGSEYIVSMLSEFFEPDEIGGKKVAWYRIPMMSNKPSSEFIRFIRYNGADYKSTIISGLHDVFNQEISRIQTVEMMDEQGSNVEIENFRKKGKDFQFLDFLNKERRDGTELGKLIDAKIKGQNIESEGEARLKNLLDGYVDKDGVRHIGAIEKAIDAKADAIIEKWKKLGIFEQLDSIQGISRDFSNKDDAIRNFIWNDTFAAVNFLELTVTDIALYKNAEDLQKRLAQLHSPGLRGNVEATDFDGNKVAGDGTIKSIVISDFKKVMSNVIDNLSAVFDKKIQRAEATGDTRNAEGWRVTKESIISQFKDINVTDGQAYKCPVSARKIGFIFGTWTRENEELYKKFISGNYTYNDVKNAFSQPRKPFVYGTTTKSLGVDGAPLNIIRKGVQYKNSEYLLILADAIMRSEKTGMPNLLRSIYAFMEQSFKINPNNGIDTVMFDSCVKTGKGNMLDINQFLSMEGEAGENAAYQYLMNNVILDGGVYNDLYVDKVGIEDYSEQQEIPEHFKDHEQVHGSQMRYIIPSDLEFVDDDGNQITYDYVDNGVAKKVNATEFRDEYERTIAENINEDIEAIKQEIGLGSYFMSNADKNVAISKLLQREILSNPRYGVDLLQACSIDENGNFKIPLNDPIQSRRVEQLLNSIVKNGVNKQKLAGGPIVQVSNFGTSHRLSIVFKGKDGNVLVNRSEYKAEEHDGKSYEDYVKENQAGIAYFEAYAPIYSDELLKFADENGVINTDVIDKVNPDLLKMIGYRIPSEDKYSVVPIKIVGFLPREAGDALMLPYEITTLTGSDFDIDKIYCIRKEIKLTRGIEQALKDELKPDFSNEESKKAFFAEKNKIIREQLFNVLPDDVLSQDERNAIEDNVDEVGSVYKDEEGNEKRIEPMNEQYDKLEEQHKVAIEKINKKYAEDEEKKNRAIDRETKEYNKKLADLEKVRAKRIAKGVAYQNKVKKHQLITDFLKSDKFAPTEDPTTLAMRDKWLSLVYGTSVKQEGRLYRNNKIFDMSWATLTHETTASKMLNPGGFTPQKTVGYAVTAYKNGATKEDGTKYSLSELMELDVDTLKDLCYSDKNLVYIDTHVQFYNQNAAASQILGIFAVAKVAHTALSGYNYSVDVASTLQTPNEFNIMGHSIGGMMEIDPMYDSNGALISKTLGSLVASAADAVKDPVLNLMNINADTVNVLNLAIRLGVPFEDIALLLSTDTISRAIQYFNTQKLGKKITFNKIIGEWIRSYERKNKIDTTKLPAERLTREEVETAINGEQTKEVDYKILKAYDRLSKIANQIRGLDFLTRFNSITSAVGPQIIDNISKEYKYDKFGNNIYKQNIGYEYNKKLYHIGDTIDIDGADVVLDVPTAQRLVQSGVISIGQTETRKIKQADVLNEHPILDAFSNTLDLSKEIMSVFPQYSGSFRGAIAQLGENTERFLMSKDGRQLLSDFSDFYQSYLLIQSGAIKQEEAKYLIEQLPIDFFKQNVKQWFPNNPFIQAITQGVINTKDGKTRATLEINTNGLDSTQIEKLQIGWAQLQKDSPELSRKLFKYAFFKGGIGFNPKTFMNLAPIQVKLAFKEYIETYANPPEVAPRDVAIQFVRNNGSNTELVPIIDVNLKSFGDSGMFYSGDYRMNSLDYFKIGDQNSQIFYFTGTTTPAGVRLFAAMTELGNHGEYLEFTQKPMLNDGIQQASQIQPITVDSAPVMEQMTENEFDASKALREIFNEAQIGKHKAYQETVKDSPEHRELYIKHFNEQLSKKGIKLNREQLEEVYNEFC